MTNLKLISQAVKLFILITTCNLKMVYAVVPHNNANEFGDINLSTDQLIKKYGYPAETHRTVTEDGYVLTLHRIPHGRQSKQVGYPILAAHGMLGDSSQFVLLGNNSIGLYLADEGYDVWLINFRGTYYTRTHKYLPPADRRFWDFSLHEQGIYDLPACIRYICKLTKHDELIYLGYSMGTAAFYIMASERPEYQANIRGAAMLSSVAAHKYLSSPFWGIPSITNILKIYSEINTNGELRFDITGFQRFAEKACYYKKIKSTFCEYALFALSASKIALFGEIPSFILNHHPASTSMKNFLHYTQIIKSGRLRQFDYDLLHNLIVYKYRVPPEYNLRSLTVPVSIFTASTNIFHDKNLGIEALAGLSNVKSIFVVPRKEMGPENVAIASQHEVLYPEVAHWIKNIIFINRNATAEVSPKRQQSE